MTTIAIDATYTVDPKPSGIAVYSRRLIEALASLDTPHHFLICYRLSRLRTPTRVRERKFMKVAPSLQSIDPNIGTSPSISHMTLPLTS